MKRRCGNCGAYREVNPMTQQCQYCFQADLEKEVERKRQAEIEAAKRVAKPSEDFSTYMQKFSKYVESVEVERDFLKEELEKAKEEIKRLRGEK